MEEHPGRVLEALRAVLGHLGGHLGGSGGGLFNVNFIKSLQGGLRGILGGSWERLGTSLGILGGSWKRLGASLGARGGLQMACTRQREGLGRVWGPHKNEKSMFFLVLGGQMLVFPMYFDGRPC